MNNALVGFNYPKNHLPVLRVIMGVLVKHGWTLNVKKGKSQGWISWDVMFPQRVLDQVMD